MMKITHDLDNLITKLQDRERELDAVNNTTYDATQDSVVIPGTFLHQSTDEASEQESAMFERGNPEVMRLFQSLKQRLEDALD